MMLGAIGRRYTSSFGSAVIRGLLVLVCLLLRDGLTMFSMLSESMSGSIIYVKLVHDWKADCKYFAAYVPQVGLSAEEKDDLWDSFIIVLSGIPKQDSNFIEINGHVGRDADGYDGVHGVMGFGTRNAEGERILEFGDAVGMAVCNTFFKKDESKLITYQYGDTRSMNDYLMVRKTYRCLVKYVKVISSE